MAIQNYAIIDHVGSLTSEQNLDMYNKIYSKAESEGYKKKKTCVTLKTVCMKDSPFARQVTDKMKNRIRAIKNPKKVYFICNKLNSKSEAEARKWCKRNIPVEMYDVEAKEVYEYDRSMMCASEYAEWEPLNIEFDEGQFTVMRALTAMWAPAFNYPLSAPAIRIQESLIPENYCERPERKQLKLNPLYATVDPNETHYTKPFTSSTKFILNNRAIAPKKEIEEFIKYFEQLLILTGCKVETRPNEYFGSVSGNIDALAEFLDIDYTICRHCHRPRKLTETKDQFGNQVQGSVCPHCEAQFNEGRFGYDTYYENNFVEDDFDTFEDTEYEEDVYYTSLELELNM